MESNSTIFKLSNQDAYFKMMVKHNTRKIYIYKDSDEDIYFPWTKKAPAVLTRLKLAFVITSKTRPHVKW